MTAGVALAATIGAGATAQLGAMRINEEIDALEVMGIRTIAYLASSRVVAGVIVVIPLYCVAALSGFVSARWCTTAACRRVPETFVATFSAVPTGKKNDLVRIKATTDLHGVKLRAPEVIRAGNMESGPNQ